MSISKSERKDPIYAKHSLQELIQAFKGYQGQAPEDAQYIFLGLDANFAADIEESPVFEEVIEYLTDGVGYWIRRNPIILFYLQLIKRGVATNTIMNFQSWD